LKLTGTKLNNLEKLTTVKSFLNAILQDKVGDWNQDEVLGFSEIYHELIHKINDCIAPLSNAFYSSIMIYGKGNPSYLIHAGANIDPDTKEQLKDPVHRNCAEKQAAVSASKQDNETNENLKVLFLFRKSQHHEVFPAEKLIPCKDCYRTYVEDLMANKGKLVLVIEDSEYKDFFLPGYEKAEQANKIRTIKSTRDGSVNYVVIDSEAMKFLKIEPQLGARVNCHSERSEESSGSV